MTELETLPKPCPFCGKEASISHDPNKGWKVKCNNFLCVVHQYGHPTKEDAVEEWNRRVIIQKALDKTIKEDADVWQKLAEI